MLLLSCLQLYNTHHQPSCIYGEAERPYPPATKCAHDFATGEGFAAIEFAYSICDPVPPGACAERKGGFEWSWCLGRSAGDDADVVFMKDMGIENVEFSGVGSKSGRTVKRILCWYHDKKEAVLNAVVVRRSGCSKFLPELEIMPSRSDEVHDKFQPLQAGAKVLAGG